MITLLVGIHIVPYVGEIDNQPIYLPECPLSESGYVSDRRNSSHFAFESSVGLVTGEMKEIVQVSAEESDVFEDCESLLADSIDTTDVMIPEAANPLRYGVDFILSLFSLQSVEDRGCVRTVFFQPVKGPMIQFGLLVLARFKNRKRR